MMITKPQDTATPAKAKKRSVFGMLFNPQLGPAISPLRESTRMFVQLVASVFAIYKLIPKDYPGLRDENAHLSFGNIIRTAWGNLRFTREGAPQAIIFFAVISVIAVSGIVAITTIMSLLIGHAHAQGLSAVSPSIFQAESSSDLAQSWLNYLFNNPSSTSLQDVSTTYSDSSTTSGSLTTTMVDPFGGSQVLQKSLMGALAMYSDAILIVAAIILFYHLAAMIVETAHHGVPMGKRASQIWAPIRLVFAIGLLVPINGGLSAGQFIVVKVAEMGSGLASHVWGSFLNQLAASTSSAPVALGTTDSEQVAYDIIRAKACALSWNYHVNQVSYGLFSPTGMLITTLVSPATGAIMYTLKESTVGSAENTCGTLNWNNSDGNAYLASALKAQQQAESKLEPEFNQAAAEISKLFDAQPGQAVQPIQLSKSTIHQAAQDYQNAVNANLPKALNSAKSDAVNALNAIAPYGWVMAGSYLNTINRIQSGISGAISGSKPSVTAPRIMTKWDGKGEPDPTDIGGLVTRDLQNFGVYKDKAVIATQSTVDPQCTAMAGLTSGSVGEMLQAAPVDAVFTVVDAVAYTTGLWTMGTNGGSCDVANAPQAFKFGIQIKGHDPFAALAAFGQASIRTASMIVGIDALARASAKALEATGQAIASGAGSLPIIGEIQAGTGAAAAGAGAFISGSIDVIQPMVYMICFILWTAGFLLGFMVPIMPFMRFTFAVLSWVAAIIEAVIAIPLVALAHLNPEGEGLPGQAKGAYMFAFNLFLRPVLTVFGLIAALIVFMIAVSFINYAFAVAVSGAGASAHGTAVVSKILYTAIYVSMIYVVANHSFQLIDHIPQHALSWMGAQGQAMAKMGDADKMESLGTAAGYVIANQGQQAIGKSIGKGIEKKGEYDFGQGETAGRKGTNYNSLTSGQRNNKNFMAGYSQGSTHGRSGGQGVGDDSDGGGGGDSGGLKPDSPAAMSATQNRNASKAATKDFALQEAKDKRDMLK